MAIFVILTSHKEEHTIGRAVEQLLWPNKDLWGVLRLVVVAPDRQTLSKAKEICQKCNYNSYTLLQDTGKGKATALNTAVEYIKANYPVEPEKDVLIFTDGDMYVGDDSVREVVKPFQMPLQGDLEGLGVMGDADRVDAVGRVGGVGGYPVSLDDRATQFGYYSHLFCEAAHVRRLKNRARYEGLEDSKDVRKPADFVPMSGYLYAVRFIDGLFPIPPDVRAEDAYISKKLVDMGYTLGYVPEALAYVRFPKSLGDWLKQKTRSLGGNIQLARVADDSIKALESLDMSSRLSGSPLVNLKTSRNINQDLAMLLFPLTFAKTPKEFVWSLILYPLRLYLWFRIYYNHIFNRYSTGMWERIESTKQ